MANSYTPNYKWELPEVGGSADNWGQVLNSSITSVDTTVNEIRTDLDDIIDSAVTFAGSDTKAMSGPLILFADPPAKPTSGTDTGIKYAATRNYVDTQIADVKASAGLQLTGNTTATAMTGPLYLQDQSSLASDADTRIAVSKLYVDNKANTLLPKGGNTSSTANNAAGPMTGPLYLNGNPTSDTTDKFRAATRDYVDSKAATGALLLSPPANTVQTLTGDVRSSYVITSTSDNTVLSTIGYVKTNAALLGATAAQEFKGAINISGANQGSNGALNVTNTITCNTLKASSDITLTSDERLKEDIRTIEHATGIVEQLRGVSYVRKDTGKLGIGVVAQEVEKVLPQLVATDVNGMKSVAYANMVGVLIQAVKELSARVDELEAH